MYIRNMIICSQSESWKFHVGLGLLQRKIRLYDLLVRFSLKTIVWSTSKRAFEILKGLAINACLRHFLAHKRTQCRLIGNLGLSVSISVFLFLVFCFLSYLYCRFQLVIAQFFLYKKYIICALGLY